MQSTLIIRVSHNLHCILSIIYNIFKFCHMAINLHYTCRLLDIFLQNIFMQMDRCIYPYSMQMDRCRPHPESVQTYRLLYHNNLCKCTDTLLHSHFIISTYRQMLPSVTHGNRQRFSLIICVYGQMHSPTIQVDRQTFSFHKYMQMDTLIANK